MTRTEKNGAIWSITEQYGAERNYPDQGAPHIFHLIQPHYTAGFVVEHTSVNMALPSNVSVAKESDLAKLVESGRAKPLSKNKDDESSEDSDDNTTLWETMHRSKNKKKKALSSSDDEEKEEGEEDEDEEEDDDDVENDEEDENDDDEAKEEEQDCETNKRKSWVADILVSREENPSSEHNKEGELTLLHTALRFISSLDEEFKNQNMEMSDFVRGIVRSCCKSNGPIHQALPPRSDIVRGVSDERIGANFDDLFQKDNNVPVRLAFNSWLSIVCSLVPFRADQGRIKKIPKQDPLIVHVSATIFEIMISLLNIKIPGVKMTKKMIETKNLMMPREIGVILERAIINAIRSKRSSYKRSERRWLSPWKRIAIAIYQNSMKVKN